MRSPSSPASSPSAGAQFGYKLTGGNVGVTGKKITLPHYMAMFIQPAGAQKI